MASIQTVTVQTSFVAGELSPRLLGRSDIRQYGQGCQTLSNFIVQKHGGATKRPGTRHVAACKSHAAASRLIEFQFSDEQGYALELGNSVMRFFRFDGSGDPGQLESSPGTPTEIATPWPTAALSGIKYAQSADTMTLCAEDYAPRRLRRTGTDDTLTASWTLDSFPFEDGPYDAINTTATMIGASATTGSVTLTASAALFAATDVGRWVRLFNGGTPAWGAAQITAYTDTTHVTATVLTRLPFTATTATANWRMGSWHSGTTGGSHWPRTVTYHQSRLWFGGSEAEPQRLWASEVDDFVSFSPSQADADVLDTDAIDVTVADNRVNSIRWLVSDRTGLMILTSGGEFVATAANDAPITPSQIAIRRHSTRGANEFARPTQVGIATLFFQTDRKLRELTYSFSADRLDGPDLAVLSEHLTRQGIEDAAFMETPDSQLWALVGDGSLVCVTLEREQQIVGWSRQTLGGAATVVESLSVVRYNGVDSLWLSVARTINGGTKRYVEVLQPAFDHGQAQEDAWHLDSGLRYEGVAADTISGLSHLEGQTVRVLADGATHPDCVVASAAITLDAEYENVLVGLPIESTLTTMPLIPPAPFDAKGMLRSVKACHVHLWSSMGGEWRWNEGSDDGTDYPFEWRTQADAMGSAPPLFTGTMEVDVAGAPDRDPSFSITHSEPQPFTVLALSLRMEVGYG